MFEISYTECLNLGKGFPTLLIKKVSEWVALMMLALQSSLQPFPQAHLCCELFKRFDPCATAPLPTTPLQVVQGLQSLHFVFCHFCLSCKAGMYSLNHLFQKLSAKNLSVSTSFLPKCLPSQKNQVAKCGQLSSVAGGWGSKVCIHWDQNCTEGPGVQYQLHLSENCCEHLFLHQAFFQDGLRGHLGATYQPLSNTTGM